MEENVFHVFYITQSWNFSCFYHCYKCLIVSNVWLYSTFAILWQFKSCEILVCTLNSLCWKEESLVLELFKDWKVDFWINVLESPNNTVLVGIWNVKVIVMRMDDKTHSLLYGRPTDCVQLRPIMQHSIYCRRQNAQIRTISIKMIK